jgi:hypothetical protein
LFIEEAVPGEGCTADKCSQEIIGAEKVVRPMVNMARDKY